MSDVTEAAPSGYIELVTYTRLRDERDALEGEVAMAVVEHTRQSERLRTRVRELESALASRIINRHENLTLGQLIEAINRERDRSDASQPVRFDFVNMHPTRVASYRGFYDQLAIGYTDQGPEATVHDVLTMLTRAVGDIFDGYKGGRFLMRSATPMWVANYGEAGSTAIVGVYERNSALIIETAHVEV